MDNLKKFKSFTNENYEYEDFTLSDMEDVKEYWNDGCNEMYAEDVENCIDFISTETMIDKSKVRQIIHTMLKSGEIVI